MRSFQLDYITMIAFKSFRSYTKIEFPQSAGLRYLTGRNEIEPRLGANGAGKSSMWDAMFWCFYGTSILDDRASDLVSWGSKRPEVAVVLWANGALHKIKRMGSPERLELDDELCSQAKLDELLGLSKARFKQAIIFGQGMPMFFDLDMPSRGKLLDEALDLSIWTKAADEAAIQFKVAKEAATEHRRLKSFAEGKLDGLPKRDELQRQENDWAVIEQRRKDTILAKLDAAEDEVGRFKGLLDMHRDAYAAMPRPDLELLRECEAELARLQARRSELIGQRQADGKDGELFEDEHIERCPTCKQAVSAEYAQDMRRAIDRKQIKLVDEIDALKKDIDKAITTRTEVKRAGDARHAAREGAKFKGVQLAQEVKAAEDHFDRLCSEAENDATSINPYSAMLAELATKQDAIELEIHEAGVAELLSEGQALLYDQWKSGFKKVRLFIVKRILLQLEIDTANAASLLGIGDWSIKFSTEAITKSDTLKHGIHIQVTSPSSGGAAAIQSGGEGQRIRLAINMGLSSLIQRMSGVRYDFEIWDEPSDGLSDEGINDLLDCLHYRARVTEKAIWLTDHRTFNYAFSEIWTAVKTASGTSIEKGQFNE